MQQGMDYKLSCFAGDLGGVSSVAKDGEAFQAVTLLTT